MRSGLRHFLANRWFATGFLLVVGFPLNVHAHTPIEGAGDFVAGLLHPLTTPTHLLVLLALGLMLGQHPPLRLKTPLLVFIPLSALALVLTTAGWFTPVPPAILLTIALGAAALVAWEKTVPPLANRVLLAAAAIALGLDSAVEKTDSVVVTKTLLGTAISLPVVLFDVAYYTSLCARKSWMRIGVRVLGSWIIAIALLVLAFSFRPSGAANL